MPDPDVYSYYDDDENVVVAGPAVNVPRQERRAMTDIERPKSDLIKLRTDVPVHDGNEHVAVQWWELFDGSIELGLPSLQQAYGMGTGIVWKMFLSADDAIALGEALITHARMVKAGTQVVRPVVKKGRKVS